MTDNDQNSTLPPEAWNALSDMGERLRQNGDPVSSEHKKLDTLAKMDEQQPERR